MGYQTVLVDALWDTQIGYERMEELARYGKSTRSVVTVHYTGRTINGKKFDSSLGGTAPAFRLNQLITGWKIALQQMCIGDKWEIYVPAEQGYGSRSLPGIPGGSTLIFEIELLGIA